MQDLRRDKARKAFENLSANDGSRAEESPKLTSPLLQYAMLSHICSSSFILIKCIITVITKLFWY